MRIILRSTDAVANWLQRDDGDEERLGLAWQQEPGGEYAVRITLETPKPSVAVA